MNATISPQRRTSSENSRIRLSLFIQI